MKKSDPSRSMHHTTKKPIPARHKAAGGHAISPKPVEAPKPEASQPALDIIQSIRQALAKDIADIEAQAGRLMLIEDVVRLHTSEPKPVEAPRYVQ